MDQRRLLAEPLAAPACLLRHQTDQVLLVALALALLVLVACRQLRRMDLEQEAALKRCLVVDLHQVPAEELKAELAALLELLPAQPVYQLEELTALLQLYPDHLVRQMWAEVPMVTALLQLAVLME